jgi:putative membrane-bound dehydrogenase-like protein
MLRASLLALLLASPAFAQLDPEKALASMKAGDGLQVELFAAEPMVINPTSMDIDPLGRVWVAEAVNYRCKLRNKPLNRPEGDRIQVLIDEKGEGKATKAVTFYQGKDLYAPLSVCVIPTGKGYRVLAAQSPDILEFTCKDAANPVADGPPKKFLTGFGGFDHDHGVHGLHLGPDGKLYFTVGDQGVKGLQSSDGKGRKFDSNKTDVQGGTVWRCDLDGKNLELIAHNFRNNYEACVDSFGEIWLSDNDDDGNQQTRICHVMPGGNYGYFPRGPGQSHWHEEQPGIVHKTLRTGFGSPTGIQFYEGSLLPKQYYNTLMHTDAGPRELRAFTRKPKGAGYELDKANMLTSSDTWFRPSDVCTAPDGSVFVCDWYDPGVGGHGMGDWTRGRVYRITPTGHKGYKVPEEKLDTRDGIKEAFLSPNLATRAAAVAQIRTLSDLQANAAVFHALLTAKENGPEFSMRVSKHVRRPLVPELSAAIQKELGFAEGEMEAALKPTTIHHLKTSPAFRQSDVRHIPNIAKADAPELKKDLQEFTFELIVMSVNQEGRHKWFNTGVFREALIELSKLDPSDNVIKMFYALANFYDGQDIFYRAALNIACGTDPVRRDAILADFEKHFPEWNDKVADLVWELRPKSMMPKMGELLKDAKITATQKGRIVDILAASDSPDAGKTMLGLLASDQPPEVKARAIENLKLFLPTKWSGLVKGNELKQAIEALMGNNKTMRTGLQLIVAANAVDHVDLVLAIFGGDRVGEKETIFEAIQALGKLRSAKSFEFLKMLMTSSDPKMEVRIEATRAMGNLASTQAKDDLSQKALAQLESLVKANPSPELTQVAIEALASTRAGTGWLLQAAEKKELPEALMAFTGRLLRNSPFAGERSKALQLFPAPGKLDPKKLPTFAELAQRVGNIENGKAILAKSATGETQCLKCHIVNGVGGKIGPDLSGIGKKVSKENLFESMILPSKAIADQYLSWKVDTDDGQSIVGLLVGETETTITIRDANGKDYNFPAKGTEKKKQLTSIMPEGLIATLTEDELVDVVEYLFSLKTEPPMPMK